MIPFPFNENRFSFFVADHLLVGQVCKNPKSDRSLLSSLKVTQCSTRTIREAPLYNACSLPIQVVTTGPLSAPSKCKSGLPLITGTCPVWWKQSFRLRLWSLVWFQVRAASFTSHLRCRLESQRQSVLECAEECGHPLVQSGGRWQSLCMAAGFGASPQVQRDPGLASESVLRLCTLLSLVPLPLRPEPAELFHLVIRREHYIHDLPQHQSQPDRRYPPNSRRCLWKRHAPSSGYVSRQWLRLKVAT